MTVPEAPDNLYRKIEAPLVAKSPPAARSLRRPFIVGSVIAAAAAAVAALMIDLGSRDAGLRWRNVTVAWSIACAR